MLTQCVKKVSLLLMKLLSLILTLGALFTTQALAQNVMQISGSGPTKLSCSGRFQPSAKMVKLTQSKSPVARCTGDGQTYEIAFIGVTFNVDEVEFNKQPIIGLSCIGESAAGVYLFGGYPIGFQTKTSSRSPWFYEVQDEEGNAGGRCSLEYSSSAITSIEATQNQSALLLLKVGG